MKKRTQGSRAAAGGSGAGNRPGVVPACGLRLSTRFARRLPFSSLLLALALAGCKKDPVTGCDPCFTTAVAYGSVRDAEGNLVPQIPFSIGGYLAASCDASFRVGGNGRTDAEGRFRGLLSSLYSPFTAHCFEVTVNPDSTAPLPTETFLFQDSVRFRDELDGEPRDSIRLDVTLGSGAGSAGGTAFGHAGWGFVPRLPSKEIVG